MGFYEDKVLPRFINLTCGIKGFDEMRAQTAEGLHGDIVEIGFGSGLNVAHYPGAVTRVRAVEPSMGGRRIGRKRIDASAVPIDFVGLRGEQLPLEDASVPCVLSTFTLCTIPDVDAALGEIHRVLEPGGTFHFLEHGRSPDAKVAKWQNRWNPVQMKVAGGCHVNRDIERLIADAGFRFERIDHFYLKGPKVAGYMSEGVATAA